MSLCYRCQTIFPRVIVPALPPDYFPGRTSTFQDAEAIQREAARERQRVLFRHHANAQDLLFWSRVCDLCKLLRSALISIPVDEPRESFPWPYDPAVEIEGIPSLKMEYEPDDQVWGRPAGSPAELVQLMVRCGSQGPGLLRVYADKGSPAALSGDVSGREPSSEFDTGPYFQTPRTWLQDCFSNHAECQLSERDCNVDDLAVLPTRVIDVSRFKQPHLVETTNLKVRHGRYAALSHCWGTSPTFKTTKLNLVANLEAIPLSTLPKTFREAVSVTRWLGIRYLWIDALCIIQDSPEDWKSESAEMGRIYHHAHVTISATSAKDHSEGLFIPHPKPVISPVEMPYLTRNGERAGSFYISKRAGSFPTLEQTGVLNTRAWTLQEKFLSRRILHFAKDQMYWECLHHKKAEDCSPFDDNSDYNFNSYGSPFERKTRFLERFPNLRFKPSLTPVLLDADESPLYCIVWNELVENLTSRNITYPSDKLPAVQGIANAIKWTTGSEYYAGLWKFSPDLMWRRKRDAKLTKPETPRAPSWSWASLDGPIEYNGLEPWAFGDNMPSTKDVKDIAFDIKERISPGPGGSNLFIVTGSVSLTARYNVAYRITQTISESFDPWKNFDYEVRARRMPDASPLGTYVGSYTRNGRGYNPLVGLSGPSRQTKRIVGWGAFDEMDWDLKRPFACLLIDRLGSAYKPRSYYVLLVVKIEASNTYKRVGMGQITEESWFDESSWGKFIIY